MEPGYGRSRLGPGKDQDLDQELDNIGTIIVKMIFLMNIEGMVSNLLVNHDPTLNEP